LNSLGLWQFSLGLWVLAYSALALALTSLWFLIVYGTKIIVAYAAAAWLFERLFHRRAFWMDVPALLAGTLVYTLLRAIPYAGWIFGVLVTAAGAGAAWLAYRARRQKPTPAAAASPAASLPGKRGSGALPPGKKQPRK
jgi:hypothetical protein